MSNNLMPSHKQIAFSTKGFCIDHTQAFGFFTGVGKVPPSPANGELFDIRRIQVDFPWERVSDKTWHTKALVAVDAKAHADPSQYKSMKFGKVTWFDDEPVLLLYARWEADEILWELNLRPSQLETLCYEYDAIAILKRTDNV